MKAFKNRLATTLAVFGTVVLLAGSVLADDVYINEYSGNKICRYDSTGTLVYQVDPTNVAETRGPDLGIAMSTDGTLYVGDYFNKVARYDGKTGAFLSAFSLRQSWSRVEGLAFGWDKMGIGNDNLYVVDFAAKNIAYYNGATGTYGGNLLTALAKAPNDIKFGADGLLYVANSGGVDAYDSTGKLVSTRSLSGGSLGLAFGSDLDGDGNSDLFATNTVNVGETWNRVMRWDAVNGYWRQFIKDAGGLNNPNGLAFDSNGDLYVASTGSNSVLRYNGTTGAYMDVFASGLNVPTGILVAPSTSSAPVPEPGSIMMLGTGLLGMAGFALRKRK